jgi:hypothetical protein
MQSVVNSSLVELNEKVLHFNPLLDTWQNTPRGGVFLNDESGILQKLEKIASSDDELAYLLKRQAKLERAIELFSKNRSNQNLVQLGFVYRSLRKPEKILAISKELTDPTWSHYFESEYFATLSDTPSRILSLRKSLEANPKNLHALLGLISSQQSLDELKKIEADLLSFKSPAAEAAYSSKLFEFGDYKKSVQYSASALNSGFLQTNTFLTHTFSQLNLNQKENFNSMADFASQYGVSELRAALGLAGIDREFVELADMFYGRDKVKIVKSKEIASIQGEAYRRFNAELIHDGDASDFNGRYFSLDVTSDLNFADYFNKLDEIYFETFRHNPDALDFDFKWSDVSVTTNSTRINNHLHTAGPNREYLYTAVTYPVVPQEISKISNAGYLRVGPPVLPGFNFKTWVLEIMPSPDTIIFFPSSYFHESISLPGQTTKRVSINTDFARFLTNEFRFC